MTDAPLFEVRDLVKRFPLTGGGWRRPRVVHAVEGVNLTVGKGETLALVGESGSGKTTLARTAALLQPPTSGSVRFNNQDITGLGNRRLKPVRRRIQMIFQDPFGSLNPRLPIGAIIAEPLVIHSVGNRAERRQRTLELVEAVGLDGTDLSRYPHQFSGGQRQRIAIARALALDPDLIIADEPVSALDVSIQSQILNLLADLRRARGLAYLFISHDLAVVRHVADRVAVMYLGRIVEEAPVEALFRAPRHPYTRALIAAAPVIGRGKRRPGKVLPGDPPSPISPPSGCSFHPRCPLAHDLCRTVRPVLDAVANTTGHRAACHLKDDTAMTETTP